MRRSLEDYRRSHIRAMEGLLESTSGPNTVQNTPVAPVPKTDKEPAPVATTDKTAPADPMLATLEIDPMPASPPRTPVRRPKPTTPKASCTWKRMIDAGFEFSVRDGASPKTSKPAARSMAKFEECMGSPASISSSFEWSPHKRSPTDPPSPTAAESQENCMVPLDGTLETADVVKMQRLATDPKDRCPDEERAARLLNSVSLDACRPTDKVHGYIKDFKFDDEQ
ncbi:hypothetical protein EDC01DRAFT_630642 [Geopyxis carbonaria]|nr:hypothetical protein EDC01DRAFT_630642 [Geopyxis carbonaria]